MATTMAVVITAEVTADIIPVGLAVHRIAVGTIPGRMADMVDTNNFGTN